MFFFFVENLFDNELTLVFFFFFFFYVYVCVDYWLWKWLALQESVCFHHFLTFILYFVTKVCFLYLNKKEENVFTLIFKFRLTTKDLIDIGNNLSFMSLCTSVRIPKKISLETLCVLNIYKRMSTHSLTNMPDYRSAHILFYDWKVIAKKQEQNLFHISP